MNPKVIMDTVFKFVSDNYNKGKKIANHTTWIVIVSLLVIGEMIIDGQITVENWGMLKELIIESRPFIYLFVGGRVVGGGFKGYVETKHGNGHTANEASK